MVTYNPKNWLLPIFQIHRADTFRKLFWTLVFIALYSTGIVYLEIVYLKLSQDSHARNIITMHTLLGFAISMLLVFRTNTAYDRWWEGRKLWGSLVNSSRNLALKLNVLLADGDVATKLFFKKAIPFYATALRRHLLKEELLESDLTLLKETIPSSSKKHLPNQIAERILQRVNDLYLQQKISGHQLLLLSEELRSFTDICGACERIKNTPIPYSYSAFIKKFIFIYTITLPVGFAFNLGYYTVPVTTFIFYVLASLELIAEEIEDPFGRDSNDLPMKVMAETIRTNVEEILD